jgi:hypothetical protein
MEGASQYEDMGPGLPVWRVLLPGTEACAVLNFGIRITAAPFLGILYEAETNELCGSHIFLSV